MNRYAVVSGEYNIAFTQPISSIVISNGDNNIKYDFNKFQSFVILPKDNLTRSKIRKE
jgi:hypothetical protein